MTMPNFVIIGAAKSGTSALYRYLSQHPFVYMSTPKEPNFFAVVGEKLNFRNPDGTPALINKCRFLDVESYRRLFDGVKNETAVGEASVAYLSSPRAAERIHHHLPEVKLVAILRDPVEAAYSAFLMTLGFGIEPCKDFAAALRDQERRIRKNCYDGVYLESRFYHCHLQRYARLFDRDQLRVYLYDDFQADPQGVLKDIFRFLEVDEDFVPDMSIRGNVSGVPRSMALHRFLTPRSNPFLRRFGRHLPDAVRRPLVTLRTWNLVKPGLSEDLRSDLTEVFREDILRLQDFLNRDLAKWLDANLDGTKSY